MMLYKLSNMELAYVVTFGTLWGVSEITLGFMLHNLHIPFTGLIQTFIGAVLALITLKLTNRKRVIIYTAMIAAIQKMLSFTTIKIFPFIGILMSAAIGQSVISVLGINIIGFIIAGALMCSWPLAQSLFFYLLAYTTNFLGIYQELLDKIHLGNISVWMVVKIIFLLHFIVGAIAALLAWKIASAVRERMKKELNDT